MVSGEGPHKLPICTPNMSQEGAIFRGAYRLQQVTKILAIRKKEKQNI